MCLPLTEFVVARFARGAAACLSVFSVQVRDVLPSRNHDPVPGDEPFYSVKTEYF